MESEKNKMEPEKTNKNVIGENEIRENQRRQTKWN